MFKPPATGSHTCRSQSDFPVGLTPNLRYAYVFGRLSTPSLGSLPTAHAFRQADFPPPSALLPEPMLLAGVVQTDGLK